jgi:hypothetical protein
MTPADSLVHEVRQRIVDHELARRVGRRSPAHDEAAVTVTGAPPLTALTGRVFGRAVLERRQRFLQAVGWIALPLDECVPGRTPALPDVASIEDHLAVMIAAGHVRADDVDVATMAASLDATVVGTEPAPLDAARWDEHFDRIADGLVPGWRHRVTATGSAWAALEAVSVAGDTWFGRRRQARSLWPVARRAVEGAAEVKRRWFR